MNAQFRVLDGQEVIKMYEMEYNSPKELNNLFHEARKVWDEYMVEVEFDLGNYILGIMRHSHTYRDQVLKFGA